MDAHTIFDLLKCLLETIFLIPPHSAPVFSYLFVFRNSLKINLCQIKSYNIQLFTKSFIENQNKSWTYL